MAHPGAAAGLQDRAARPLGAPRRWPSCTTTPPVPACRDRGVHAVADRAGSAAGLAGGGRRHRAGPHHPPAMLGGDREGQLRARHQPGDRLALRAADLRRRRARHAGDRVPAGESTDPNYESYLRTIAELVASILEKIESVDMKEESRVRDEREKLRTQPARLGIARPQDAAGLDHRRALGAPFDVR
ncbi:MAG: hypothetical protein WDN72_04345 [Alphaproteobacteria bacterium]